MATLRTQSGPQIPLAPVSVGFAALELSAVLLGLHSYSWHPLGLSEDSSEGARAGMWTRG